MESSAICRWQNSLMDATLATYFQFHRLSSSLSAIHPIFSYSDDTFIYIIFPPSRAQNSLVNAKKVSR